MKSKSKSEILLCLDEFNADSVHKELIHKLQFKINQ